MYSSEPAPVHSGLGITSFVISILMGLMIFLTFAIAGYMESTTPGGLDEESMVAGIVGLVMIAAMLGDLAAFGLGLAGLFQKNRKKLFAILGMCFSGIILLGAVGLIGLGLLIEAGAA